MHDCRNWGLRVERAHCHGMFGLSDYHQERTSPTYSQRKNNPRQLRPHLYKIGTVVMTIWFNATKYQYLKWQWIFSFLRRCFLSSITDKHFTGMCYVFVFCVLYPMVSVSSVFAPGFIIVGVELNFYPIMYCSSCYGVRYDFCITSILGSSFPSAVCRTADVLFMLFVFDWI